MRDRSNLGTWALFVPQPLLFKACLKRLGKTPSLTHALGLRNQRGSDCFFITGANGLLSLFPLRANPSFKQAPHSVNFALCQSSAPYESLSDAIASNRFEFISGQDHFQRNDVDSGTRSTSLV